MSARQERKEIAYLEQLRAQAERAPSSPGNLEEIRRWEGPAAARDAATTKPYRAYRQRTSDNRQTDPFAILALVFGILGGALGVIFGHIAIYRIHKNDEKGEGLAIAGLVCGYLYIVVSVFWAFTI